MGHSLGMIRTSGSGKIRVAPIDPKSKARISQTLQVCFFNFKKFFTFVYFLERFTTSKKYV
jgi:hypothetical protein